MCNSLLIKSALISAECGLQNDAVPVRDRNPAIPKPLAKVIDLALVDNPEIYFKSAGEFKQALLKNCPD